MPTIVITGGNGFVGTYLQMELRTAWPDMEVISWDLPEVDITKPETYKERLAQAQPDWVVHLAAIASVPVAIKQPELVRRVNVEGTRQLLVTTQELVPRARVLIVSSSEIYGKAFNAYGQQPMPELPLEQAQPLNPYAASKKEMEEMVMQDFRDMCVRVRPFPHFGPGQKEGFVTADFAAQVARIEAGHQEPLMMVGNLETQRDFTDVRDVVRAYRLLMEKGEVGDVYQVASGHPVRIKEVLDFLLGMARVEIFVEQDPQRLRPSDVPVAVGDASKLTEVTGWWAERRWQDSLAEVFEWWRSQS